LAPALSNLLAHILDVVQILFVDDSPAKKASLPYIL
jgi:hypothetical protein